MPPTTRQFLTLTETANLARVTRRTLLEWRKDPNNTFPKPLRFGPRGVRYDLAEIEAWLADQRARSWTDKLLASGEVTASEAV
jgi:predicted DNA-binding transcriptional regulator AlpA